MVAHAAYEEMRGVGKALKGEAVDVELLFIFPGRMDDKAGGPHASRPDLDNLVKLVLDAMTGVVYEDDGCVASISAAKTRSVTVNAQTIVKVTRAEVMS